MTSAVGAMLIAAGHARGWVVAPGAHGMCGANAAARALKRLDPSF